jgi:pentatricopeptide repeat protein
MISKQIKPNRTTYNTLIDMYGKCHSPNEAIGIYNTMIENNVTPCVITFTSMILIP